MNKRINTYNVKGQNLAIKDLDLEKREVAVYLSRFDVIDADNDMIIKGAFKKSLKERGVNSTSNRKIAFLRYHNWEMPIGTFKSLEEDNKGLFAVGKLGTSTLGEDALKDYDEGIIKEHSIGFKYINDKIKFIEDETMENGGYYQIKELQLWEGSAVTFGANQYTNVIDVVKSEGKKDIIEELYSEIQTVTKSLINGKGTDERLYNLEMRLKFLNARLFDVAVSNPFNKQFDLVKPEEKQTAFNWEKVIKSINF